MKRHIISALLFVTAITFYVIGAAIPGTAFLVFGGIAELIFWFRIMMNDKPDSTR